MVGRWSNSYREKILRRGGDHVTRQQDDEFLPLVHVALRLRGDIMSHPAFKGCDVSEEAELASVPPSVHMFLNVLLGGQSHVDNEFEDGVSDAEQVKNTGVCSIGQDMVYGVCGDKKAPPKHVGMGMALHQSTRSRKLVELSHNAGHIISYNRVLQYETGMAKTTLQALDQETGAVVPRNLVFGRFVHFSCDKIDINDSSLDGKIHSMLLRWHDTDILVLLLAHYTKKSCSQLWLKAGTVKKPKYVPVHEVRRELGLADHVYDTRPAFHALTGCDTVSFFDGHTKRTEWATFLKHNSLLLDLGKSPKPSEQVSRDAEKFICHIYKTPAENCNEARINLFSKCHATETLPPSSDAAKYHIERASYQSYIWREANNPMPTVPLATECGWDLLDGELSPILTSLPPIPKACKDLVQCKCTKGCSTNSCSCRRWGSPFCTEACKCNGNDDGKRPCRNRAN